jgi:hypothetical protein
LSAEQSGRDGDHPQNSGGKTHSTIMTLHRLAGLRHGISFNFTIAATCRNRVSVATMILARAVTAEAT